jgi:putative tryptophan/tyrosine transport system substrate-binding protein
MAAPSSVFTIRRVAEMLGEDEEWLQDLASEMEPEDGCLIVWGNGDQSTTVFTREGVEYLEHLRGELGAKVLALMHELVPGTATIGFLENPNNPVFELTTRDVLAAASVIGLKIQILKASTDREIDAAFASLVQAQSGALFVGNDLVFNNRIEQIILLAARHAIPSMYAFREFVVAGGLISYGTSLTEEYRQAGLYAGRILSGEKPADLPVVQATKIELIINLKTAKTLGLEVPAKLLALADEVIE